MPTLKNSNATLNLLWPYDELWICSTDLSFIYAWLASMIFHTFLISSNVTHPIAHTNNQWIIAKSKTNNQWIIAKRKKSEDKKQMVFYYQNCSDLLWEKIVLVIEKFFWNLRLNAENLQIFWDHLNDWTICSNSERSEQFLVKECFFTFFLEVPHI